MENSTLNLSFIKSQDQTIPKEVDYAMRVFTLIVYIVYFIVVSLSKELKHLSFIHMHHTNLIGLFISAHYTVWIISDLPTFEDKNLNNVLCSLSETFWAVTKHARAYSILILAIYRVIAVFKVNIYKRFIKSKLISIGSISIVWIVSGLLFIISKFSARTLPGLIYCYDGYSTNAESSLLYYSVTSLVGYILPVVFVIVLYAIIRVKLFKLTKSLSKETDNEQCVKVIDLAEFETSTMNGVQKKKPKKQRNIKIHKHKEKHLAHQFIIINSFEVGSICAFMLLSLSNIFPILNGNLYFLRQFLRILNLICQSAIPIISVVYNPAILNFCKVFFSKIN